MIRVPSDMFWPSKFSLHSSPQATRAYILQISLMEWEMNITKDQAYLNAFAC